MRNFLILGTALAALSALPVVAAAEAVCVANGNIPPAERERMIVAAQAVTNPVLAGDGPAAFKSLSLEARSKASEEELIFLARLLRDVRGDVSASISGAYLLDVGAARPDDFVDCSDTAPPEARVAVRVFDNGPRQAQVVVSVAMPNNDLALRVLLGWRDGEWRRDAVSFGMTTAAGKTGLELFELGRKQLDAGHRFNAHLLLVAGSKLIDQGAGMDLQAAPALRESMATYEAPAGFDGAAYTWSYGGQNFSVRSITMMALGGKLGIVMDHELSPWPGEAGAETSSRRLTDALMAAYPEWSDGFDFIAAKALSPAALTPAGGPSFTTVFEAGKGY